MPVKPLAAAGLVVIGLAGCAVPAPAVGTRTAELSVGGDGATATQPVSCSQTGWMWILESFAEEPGFTAVLRSGLDGAADSVQLRDIGGFTGAYWAGTTGSGEVNIEEGVFTVSGEAEGYFAEDPTDRVTVPYRVTARC
ncbi:lipoprotein LpqH [Micromonospora sp. WMMD736]|uniref:lipoprotein LpqH n=1 Tax=Micromonospora sp. WMMD736 TaxID=3404112 RepID=UPI003B9547C4